MLLHLIERQEPVIKNNPALGEYKLIDDLGGLMHGTYLQATNSESQDKDRSLVSRNSMSETASLVNYRAATDFSGYGHLKNNTESLDLYQRMDKLQQQILAAQNSGQPLSEEAQKEYQKINEEVRNNDELKDMITKEQALFQMINDVQQAMTKPIGDLYDDLKAK